jgi:hypothetical protein
METKMEAIGPAALAVGSSKAKAGRVIAATTKVAAREKEVEKEREEEAVGCTTGLQMVGKFVGSGTLQTSAAGLIAAGFIFASGALTSTQLTVVLRSRRTQQEVEILLHPKLDKHEGRTRPRILPDQ